LEAQAEGFSWKPSQVSRRFRFDFLHGSEKFPIEAHFQFMEQPKATRSEIRRLRWVGDDRMRHGDSETATLATFRAASFEVHRKVSAKLAR
jgi:hypothetical protein